MPCNLAVTITKGSVNQEYTQKLLSDNRAFVEQMILAALSARSGSAAEMWPVSDYDLRRGVVARVRYVGTTYTIYRDGSVEAQGRSYDPIAQEVSAQLTAAIPAIADGLLAIEVQQALGQMGAVTSEAVTVDNEGQRQTARIITLNI